MKKMLFMSLMALGLPWLAQAQTVEDDLYYTPSNKRKETKQQVQVSKPANTQTVVVETQAPTTIVVRDRSGKRRDVDEYNRRFDSKKYEFTENQDTLYIDEKRDSDLDGEWVNGFDGSEEDYEYATRIIRFRNPRYAISISSPYYWDVVYGLNPWDWNVYTDGFYAYAFPTFSNRFWWDWHYNAYGWGSYPYWGGWYGFGYGHYWGGWYAGWGGWWGPAYHHHHWHPAPGWGGGGHYWNNALTTRRHYDGRSTAMTRPGTAYRNGTRASSSGVRRATSVVNGGQTVRRSTSTVEGGQVRRSSSASTTRRVVGTRSSATSTTGASTRTSRGDAASSRQSTYTRPSSTRSTTYSRENVESVRRSTSGGSSVNSSSRRSASTYNRGSSTSAARERSESGVRNSNTRSYESSRSSSSSRSTSSFSTGGGSTRSSGGGFSGGGGSSRSSSGGGRRR